MLRSLSAKARILGLVISGLLATTVQAQPLGVGWIENVALLPEGVTVKAKMDSGALTSSLDARDIVPFKRNGQKWVRFKLDLTDAKSGANVATDFERPILRNVKVRGAGGVDHRPVVEMSLCIGNQRLDEEFSLRDREKMLYPVLIGRRTLERLGPVDVSRTFTRKPQCGQ